MRAWRFYVQQRFFNSTHLDTWRRRQRHGLLAALTDKQPRHKPTHDARDAEIARLMAENDQLQNSEAQFKTMNYRPTYPDWFGSLEDARQSPRASPSRQKRS